VAFKRERADKIIKYGKYVISDAEMPQAKTLTETELEILLDQVERTRHAARNRIAVLLGHWAGMRIGEIAALRIGDVVDDRGEVRSEIRLKPHQTKGSRHRSVFLPARLVKEIRHYLDGYRVQDREAPFIPSQKSMEGFTANSLTIQVKMLYRQAGIRGGSSHSGRRSFLTNLAAKGVTVRVLQELAGHRSLQTTQRYIEVNDHLKRRAVELI